MKKGEFAELKRQVWNRDNFTCVYCGLDMKNLYLQWKMKLIKRKDAKLTVDHVIPRQKAHTFKITTLENLVTSCYECNQQKGGRDNKKCPPK